MTVKSRDYKAERIPGKDKKKGKNVVWSYRFSHRNQRFGQTGFKTKAEAEAAEAKKRHEVMFKDAPTHKKQFGYLNDIAKAFIAQRRVLAAKNTVTHEEPILKPVLAFFDGKRIDRITVSDINRYIKARKDRGLANRTVNLELTFLRNFLEYAKVEGFSSINVGRSVPNLKERRFKQYRLPDQVKYRKFITESEYTKYGEIFSVYVHLREKSGLRPGEALGTKWEDLDFKNEKLYVVSRIDNELKKDAERDIDLHPHLIPMLKKWRVSWLAKMGDKPAHNYIFYNPQNPAVRAKSFRGAFRTAKEKAGLENFRDYDLRHVFISTAIMAGVDYLTIMKWTGHKSSEMIDKVYGHLRPKHTKTKMRELDFDL